MHGWHSGTLAVLCGGGRGQRTRALLLVPRGKSRPFSGPQFPLCSTQLVVPRLCGALPTGSAGEWPPAAGEVSVQTAPICTGLPTQQKTPWGLRRAPPFVSTLAASTAATHPSSEHALSCPTLLPVARRGGGGEQNGLCNGAPESQPAPVGPSPTASRACPKPRQAVSDCGPRWAYPVDPAPLRGAQGRPPAPPPPPPWASSGNTTGGGRWCAEGRVEASGGLRRGRGIQDAALGPIARPGQGSGLEPGCVQAPGGATNRGEWSPPPRGSPGP